MDRDLVQCVGELPWAGFLVGCVLLATFLALLTAFAAHRFPCWLKRIAGRWEWYRNWRLRVEKKEAEEYEADMKRWSDESYQKARRIMQERPEKIANIIKIFFPYVAWLLGGIFGAWLIWGFVAVIKCLIQN